VSLRPRRALVGLVTAVAAFAALPAAASAAESLSFTLSGTQAGSNPQIAANLVFAPGANDNPKTVTLSLAPGILSNLNANPSCLAGAQQLTAACQVGTAALSYSVAGVAQPAATGNVYLVPPAAGSNNFGGLETVITSPGNTFPNQYTGATLRTTPTVGVDLATTFGTLPPTVQITGYSNTLNPTLNSVPFTALPTSCAAATSTLNVSYQGATPAGSATGSFTPTGCSNLKYSPKLTASVARDKSDKGASIVLATTQTLGESASKTIVFTLPKGLSPNVIADAPCLTGGSGCQIGTASATSPGVPNAALANGIVKLTGTVSAPLIAVSFPAPFGLTENGAVNLAAGTVTFADVPDLPLSSLTLNVTGPNGQKAFTTDCVPASVGGQFTAQSGATATASAPIKFTNCPSNPTASGSTTGLAAGKPKLKFKVAHGKGGPNLASVAIGLPGGLSFSRSAIVSHKTCTSPKSQGKKKCSTTTLIKGLGVSGAKVKSAAIKSGKLVITFKKAAASATVNLSGPLVSETNGLKTKVKKHQTKKLTFSLKVTDAKKAATTLSLKLAAH
jgi:hypothetical protein